MSIEELLESDITGEDVDEMGEDELIEYSERLDEYLTELEKVKGGTAEEEDRRQDKIAEVEDILFYIDSII